VPGATMASAAPFFGDFFGFLARTQSPSPTSATSMVTLPASAALASSKLLFTSSGVPLLPVRSANGMVTYLSPPTKITTNVLVNDPLEVRGADQFKIVENESPMPLDRVYFNYNFFYNTNGIGGFNPAAVASASQTVVGLGGPSGLSASGGIPTTTSTNPAGATSTRVQLHREIFGFEKTFLDGNASIGVRIPIFEQEDDRVLWGDLTLIAKYAFWLDRQTGSVLSGGLAVTFPTGVNIFAFDATQGEVVKIQDVLLQPYVGWIWNTTDWYLQGFHSVVVPTDPRDVTFLANSVAAGYYLMRRTCGNAISAIIPTAEAHINTPLDHRNADSALFIPDTVTLTGGAHFAIFGNSILSLGAGAPVTGLRPFQMEAYAMFNYRF
jgi:hypothetical protein